MSYRIPPSLDEADGNLPMEAPRWFVLRVVGGRESRALAALGDLLRPKGLVAYAPCEVRWRRKDGRRGKVRRPLVPGYLFVLATSDLFHLIRAVEGVIGFLTRPTAAGPQPCAAPLEFITSLFVCDLFKVYDATHGTGPMFKVNEPVKVAVGPYADWAGRVMGMGDDGRVRVLLASMLGRQHEKTFKADQLRSAQVQKAA